MKTNYKSIILSLGLAVMGLMFFNGANAQVNDPSGKYVVYDNTAAAPANVDYVTVGSKLGYYAEPDPIYHPDYNTLGGWSLTTGFSWLWTAPTDPGTAPTFNKPGDANYVEITYPVAGDYVINVAEQSPAVFGGCSDATPQVMNVTAIPAPTAQFSTADILSGLCGDQAAEPIQLDITENIPVALAGYSFTVTESVDNIDASDNVTGNVSSNSTFVDFGLTAKVNSGTSGFAGTSPNFTYTFNSSALTVQNSARTKYTYTLTSASGVTGSGIVSAISEKSDYLAGQVNGHAFGAKTTVVFIVNPAPITGPIYHISNTFAY